MDLEDCHFIVPKNYLRLGDSNSIGRYFPKGSHKAKACKDIIELISTASAVLF
jgi:hypothetical protein